MVSPNMTGFNYDYNPEKSSSVAQNYPFRFAAGSLGVVGYWGNDIVCYSTWNSNGAQTQLCSRQDFLGGEFYTNRMGEFSGTLGLGLGNPRYGESILDTLYTISNGAIAKQWSYVSGPYIMNGTGMLIGGP